VTTTELEQLYFEIRSRRKGLDELEERLRTLLRNPNVEEAKRFLVERGIGLPIGDLEDIRPEVWSDSKTGEAWTHYSIGVGGFESMFMARIGGLFGHRPDQTCEHWPKKSPFFIRLWDHAMARCEECERVAGLPMRPLDLPCDLCHQPTGQPLHPFVCGFMLVEPTDITGSGAMCQKCVDEWTPPDGP
jgi:hypothetical protein